MSSNSESTVTQSCLHQKCHPAQVYQKSGLWMNTVETPGCFSLVTPLLQWDKGLFLSILKYKDVCSNGNPLRELQSFFICTFSFLQSLKILMFAVFSKLRLNNFMGKNDSYRVKARLEQKIIIFSTLLFLKPWMQIKEWLFPDPI